jgi:Sigma-70, region 4
VLVVARVRVDDDLLMETSAARRPIPRPLGAPRSAARLRLASDERLVEHVRAGSEIAFEALYDRHHGGILGFCRHMLGSVEEAEDALQHTFMAAYGHLSGLPDDQRAALVLAELGDVAHDEIATVLGVPRDRVKALVFQARSSLIASRIARDTPCTAIRKELAGLRGGTPRRTILRRHLRECPGCRAFRAQVAEQRRALAAALPVQASDGLKQAALRGRRP